MPQIWLTYDELADFTQRTPIAAREAAIEWGWTRRRSRDGFSRVKLPPIVATLYMAQCLEEADNLLRADEFVTFSERLSRIALGPHYVSP